MVEEEQDDDDDTSSVGEVRVEEEKARGSRCCMHCLVRGGHNSKSVVEGMNG